MLPPPSIERIALPAPVAPAARPPFPWIATVAPVVVSVVLWAITGSVLSLLFALLGPVVAVGGVVDGARARRGTARRDEQRLRAGLARVEGRILEAHERERRRLRAAGAPSWDSGGTLVRIGTGEVPGVVELSGDDDSPLRGLAAVVPAAPVLADASGGLVFCGPSVLARAAARSAAVQLAARLSPETSTLSAPDGEAWARRLPHAVDVSGEDAFVWRHGEASMTIGWGTAPGPESIPVGAGVHAITVEQAEAAAVELAGQARGRGLRPAADVFPAEVALADLPPAPVPGLAATVGLTGEGPLVLDLVADGPHALVAGTTGSGKSELLVTWILGMARGRSPDEVAFVLVDFKGGAAFAPLAELPHVLATLTDLDGRLTRRAIESLRAELQRRERVLVQHAVRAVDELPSGVLPRLVIVVDEFAAVVAASPELHEVFADLAARGRSLGLHLILCTQRPSGVVRDAVLANIGLRISLRVADRADSIAIVGDDAASRLPVSARGRAVVVSGQGTHTAQVARADAAEVRRIARQAPPARTSVPWHPPLPAELLLDDLPPVPEGLAFGLVDLPAEQRQPVAAHDPARHGHLLIVGASAAGATTAAATLAESARRAGLPVRVLADEPADAWAQLEHTPRERHLLIVDGLDALLGRFGPDHQHEFAELLTAALRDPSPGAPQAVVTARRLTGPLGAMTGLFGSRLLLRQASRDDHVLAGGGHADWDPDIRPGAGSWRGAHVQVARVLPGALPVTPVPPPVRVGLASHPVLAIVAARPRALAEPLRDAGARVIRLGRDAPPDAGALRVTTTASPTVLLGDPDAWLGDWALLTTARREWPLLFTGCAPADHRALLRARELPPPLGSDPRECWLVHDGHTRRAVFPIADAHESEEERAENR